MRDYHLVPHEETQYSGTKGTFKAALQSYNGHTEIVSYQLIGTQWQKIKDYSSWEDAVNDIRFLSGIDFEKSLEPRFFGLPFFRGWFL